MQWIKSTRPSTDDIRAKLCDDPALSQYLICYLRFIASFHLQANEDAFSPFLPDGKSIADFVRLEVEPVDHEADQIQCVALVNEIGCVRWPRVRDMVWFASILTCFSMPDFPSFAASRFASSS